MDIKTYALILLIVRLLSMAFIGLVLLRQISLFKIKVLPDIDRYRMVLFALALAIFVGNLAPAIIDFLTVFSDVDRSVTTVKTVSLIYTMNAAATALISSFTIWMLYRLSAQSDEDHIESDHIVTNDTNGHDL